jgi:hypothetical protein
MDMMWLSLSRDSRRLALHLSLNDTWRFRYISFFFSPLSISAPPTPPVLRNALINRREWYTPNGSVPHTNASHKRTYLATIRMELYAPHGLVEWAVPLNCHEVLTALARRLVHPAEPETPGLDDAAPRGHVPLPEARRKCHDGGVLALA